MSAYLCAPKHIAAIALYLFPLDHHKAAKAARVLVRENVNSIMARYGDCDTPRKACENFLGITHTEYLDRTVALTQDADFRMKVLRLSPKRVLGLAHCLNYQSCEHKGWETSIAKRLLTKLVAAQRLTWDSEYEGWSLTETEEALL